ncbi:hypothetical protein BpHYR1_011004 [Brachionus plicatilis]|uniref:Uncharacterized protein n=1 Tax=Brachionus plicatilis TaxID=10195 RepID=A0A3M7PQP4_BRAPC|nr:hypothetical protein BpHYR1_011004 [Brachionus plicatilis]
MDVQGGLKVFLGLLLQSKVARLGIHHWQNGVVSHIVDEAHHQIHQVHIEFVDFIGRFGLLKLLALGLSDAPGPPLGKLGAVLQLSCLRGRELEVLDADVLWSPFGLNAWLLTSGDSVTLGNATNSVMGMRHSLSWKPFTSPMNLAMESKHERAWFKWDLALLRRFTSK